MDPGECSGKSSTIELNIPLIHPTFFLFLTNLLRNEAQGKPIKLISLSATEKTDHRVVLSPIYETAPTIQNNSP